MTVVEQYVVVPGTKERISELVAQRDRATRELAMYEGKKLDPEKLARFLQFGSALTDGLLLDAFVYQVLVSDDDVLVTLNYDTEKNEPARFSLSRVRTDCEWLPG